MIMRLPLAAIAAIALANFGRADFMALPRWPLAPLVSAAQAHDHWISRNRLTDPFSGQWCCNRIDCAPVDAGGVAHQRRLVPDVGGNLVEQFGYRVIETGEFIPEKRVIWKSEDGRWWRCRNLMTNATRCLIGMPPGM